MSTQLIQLQTRLALYLACEAAILNGAQEYRVEDKLFRKADLADVRDTIKQLRAEIGALTPTRKRMRSQKVTFHRD